MRAMRGRRWSDGMRRWFGCSDLEELEMELPLDSVWSAEIGRVGLEVRCARGMLLVTVEGDVEDHVLSSGETFGTIRRGRLAVWALETARLRVKKGSAAAQAEVTCDGDGVAGARPKKPLGVSG